jgi:alpha-1,6-mannosyltransferase
MSTIAQVANFVAPHSGGIRTVLAELADGYGAAGHEVVQIVPGTERTTEHVSWGRREVLPGVAIAGTGYRMLRPAQVRHVLDDSTPDRVEVHDRTTLRGLCRWARHSGVRSTVVSHERVDRLLAHWMPTPAARGVADTSNRRLAQGYDSVVCTTDWAAVEFERLGVRNLRQVPLGIDHDLFTPTARDDALRARFVKDGEVLLVMASRLSPEKRPDLAIAALSVLVHHGVLARLAIAGDGPLRGRLAHQASELPVVFLGHLSARADVARLFASADVVLAPGPVETFGLSAVEALGCGTPVVVNANSALPSVIGDAGIAAAGSGMAFAAAVQRLLQRPPDQRRREARQRAERYSWPDSVRGFLAVHDLDSTPVAS